MNQFYSSLIINSKKFPNVHQVFKPLYNKEFFRRITANIEALEEHIQLRCRDKSKYLEHDRLQLVKQNCKQLVKLKNDLEKLKKGDDEAKFAELLGRVEKIEELIMPTVVRIPNRLSKLVPKCDKIVDEVEFDFQKRQNLSKILSHKKLSYINNCYSKSVVGPNSHYYFGIGAKLQHALSDYFSSELDKNNFIPLSGLCLVKSALVEAANTEESKDYTTDPCRTLTDEAKPVTLHLCEASRESILGFITSLGHIASNNPHRFYTAGSCYHQGSDWFDGDANRVSQSETVHAMILNSSIEAYSFKEYEDFKDIVWKIYKKLELPIRLVHCSVGSMDINEFDAYRIDIELPSRRHWHQVGRISYYRDYITIRVGMRRGHLIDSQLYDGQTLAAAIIENQQTALGKFIIPKVLQEHIEAYLTQEEENNYLENIDHSSRFVNQSAPVLSNYEQRRYLKHRNYMYGHAKKNYTDIQRGFRLTAGQMTAFTVTLLGGIMIDWTEVWMSLIPEGMRRFLYEYFYRPVRRCYRAVLYYGIDENLVPRDLPWDEKDKRLYQMSRATRFRDAILKERYGEEGKDLVMEKIEEIKQRERSKDQIEGK